MAHCEIHFLGAHNKIKLQRAKRRCGEMADATDLKSVPAKAGYGFESHHRHPLKCEFMRENCWSFRLCALRTVAHENARNRCLFVTYSSSTRNAECARKGLFLQIFFAAPQIHGGGRVRNRFAVWLHHTDHKHRPDIQYSGSEKL